MVNEDTDSRQSAKIGNRNAGKKWTDPGRPPWEKWPNTGSRHARAIKWIERYCQLPTGFTAGKHIALAPFQKQWLEEVLSPGVTSALMAVPRGNGKSTFLAAFALWALFDPDEGGTPQIPIVATTVGQAERTVYGPAIEIIKADDILSGLVLPYASIGKAKVVHQQNRGQLFPVSNDPDGLQGLNPSLAVCDEIGFMPQESWDSLLLAGGKRPRSLVVGIGTPGFDRHSALWHMRECVQSADPPPGFVFTEYAADEGCDLKDEDQWRKANPALAQGYMSLDQLRTVVRLSPEAHFRIFRLGQWVDGVSSWLGVDGRKAWAKLADPFEFVDNVPTWVAVDVATEHDTTAVVICQRRPDNRYHVKAKIWEPGSHGSVDVADVMQFLRECHGRWKRNLRTVAYDPRLFDIPARMLADERLPMLEFPQSLERMTPAAGNAAEMVMRGEVSHDGDEKFTWQVLNGVARPNERGFMLSRAKSRDKIDACVALLMVLAEAAHDKGQREPSAFWI